MRGSAQAQTARVAGSAALALAATALAELCVALLADVRTLAGELARVIGGLGRGLASGVLVSLAEKRRRWRDISVAVEARRELHEAAGALGERLAERAITAREHCAFALAVLARRREARLARVARRDPPGGDQQRASRPVGVLGGFLHAVGVGSQHAGGHGAGGES